MCIHKRAVHHAKRLDRGRNERCCGHLLRKAILHGVVLWQISIFRLQKWWVFTKTHHFLCHCEEGAFAPDAAIFDGTKRHPGARHGKAAQ